ncbi:MAG: response regulator, partial [Clostridiales bacterium]|nr:response regulator [Clostridiales bacterium]
MKNNVLIVDDVSLNRKLIRGILSKAVEDICFFEAEDGYKALEIIKKESIGVVILDIMMPGISGLEMIPKIREIDKNWCISIIMCSAIHEMHSIETALSLGAIDYFTKPLTEEQMKITLPLKVRNALEHYQNKLELTKFNDHIKRELDLAGQIQKSLVSEYTEGSKALMWGRYIPCEDIGGDVSFFRQDGDKCWMMMADITGHGISAAMLSTMINVVFGIYLHTIDSPAVLLSKINEMLIDIFGNSNFFLVSAFVGCLSEDSLVYV